MTSSRPSPHGRRPPDVGKGVDAPSVTLATAGLPPFERVVAEHGTTVLRVCRAVVGPDDAEDAWSETFLAALTAYPRLRAGSDVRAWLVTIAHRKAIDRVRAAQRAPVPAGDVLDGGGLDSARGSSVRHSSVRGSDGPQGHSALGIPSAPDTALWAAVAALPPKQRGAVAYHHVAGLPYADVAQLLGTSEAAARRAAADGIAALRATVDREDRT